MCYAAKLKPLKGENAELKRLLADIMLYNVVLQDLPGKADHNALVSSCDRVLAVPDILAPSSSPLPVFGSICEGDTR